MAVKEWMISIFEESFGFVSNWVHSHPTRWKFKSLTFRYVIKTWLIQSAATRECGWCKCVDVKMRKTIGLVESVLLNADGNKWTLIENDIIVSKQYQKNTNEMCALALGDTKWLTTKFHIPLCKQIHIV